MLTWMTVRLHTTLHITQMAGASSGASSDHAFWCPGTCRGVTDRPWRCGNVECPRHSVPLVKVPVLYVCPGSCGGEGARPTICSRINCSNHDGFYDAAALVPLGATLNPPEEKRSYSSIFEENAIGKGHARSMLDSPQAWSARHNDPHQWMTLDAGEILDLAGVIVAARGHSCEDQHVTELNIDSSDDGEVWVPVDNGRIFETKLKGGDGALRRELRFDRRLRARHVRLRVVAWGRHISLRSGLLLAQERQGVERLLVLDCSQLPTKVSATSMPHGAPPPRHRAVGSFGIVHIPTGRCEWAGRRCEWDVLEFCGRRSNIAAVRPGDDCSLQVRYHAHWGYNAADYCPGCIVQLYYGLGNSFSEGVVEHGIHDHRGESRVNFVAPSSPGLYYVTQTIDLQYGYRTLAQRGPHPNTHQNAIAVLRVLPTEWEEATFHFLPPEWQAQIRALLCLWRRPEEESALFCKLPLFCLFQIFGHLLAVQQIPVQRVI